MSYSPQDRVLRVGSRCHLTSILIRAGRAERGNLEKAVFDHVQGLSAHAYPMRLPGSVSGTTAAARPSDRAAAWTDRFLPAQGV